MHALDTALTLTPIAAHRYRCEVGSAYWNMVGPFGGITVATLVQAVLQHPDCLGEVVTITVNFASALQQGDCVVQAEPARTNRSTQHWMITVWQTDDQGAQQVTTTATAVTALRRETWSDSEQAMPEVPAPQDCPLAQRLFKADWFDQYEIRPIEGNLPTVWDGRAAPSRSRLWMRDAPARVLDAPALAAMSDLFFPRLWLRRAQWTPAGTVAMTVYFHASSAQMTATGSGYILGQAQAQEFRHGFFDHSAQLWNEAGLLLTTTHQIVYYKE